MTSQEKAMLELNRAAFDSFDGDNFDPDMNSYDPDGYEDTYDPDNAVGQLKNRQVMRPAGTLIRRSPKRAAQTGAAPQAQFDITITNTGTDAHNIEMFNAQNTIAEFTNSQTNPGELPVLSGTAQTIATDSPTAAILYGRLVTGYTAGTYCIYWAPNGDLVYSPFTPDSAKGVITISCKQIPYRSLVKYSERGSFRINRMRMKFSTSGQINNDLTITQKTFLGLTKTNTISPSSFFSPNQYQSLILDMPTPIDIDAERGIQYTINGASGGDQTVLINMFISNYTKSAL